MAVTKKKAETTYSKEALAFSKKYRPWCDVLMVILQDGRNYTMEETDKALEDFKKGIVIEKVNGRDDF